MGDLQKTGIPHTVTAAQQGAIVQRMMDMGVDINPHGPNLHKMLYVSTSDTSGTLYVDASFNASVVAAKSELGIT